MRSHRAEVSAASGCAKALLLGALLVGLTFIRERFFVVRERFKVTTDPAGPGRRIVDRPYDGRGDRSTAEPGWFDAGDHGGPRSAPGHLVPDPRRARTAGTSAPRHDHVGGGNRWPLNAERGTTGIRRLRRDLTPPGSPGRPDHGQCNRAIGRTVGVLAGGRRCERCAPRGGVRASLVRHRPRQRHRSD